MDQATTKELWRDPDLRNRVKVAMTAAAEVISVNRATEADQKKKWARAVTQNRADHQIESMLKLVIASKNRSTPAITDTAFIALSDADIQALVDDKVDFMAEEF